MVSLDGGGSGQLYLLSISCYMLTIVIVYMHTGRVQRFCSAHACEYTLDYYDLRRARC